MIVIDSNGDELNIGDFVIIDDYSYSTFSGNYYNRDTKERHREIGSIISFIDGINNVRLLTDRNRIGEIKSRFLIKTDIKKIYEYNSLGSIFDIERSIRFMREIKLKDIL